ncbi:ABC transporter ATP-binding protein [Ancylobacter dichloromethanicus]|uniref:ABC transporter ATP-binding protein n=1 Tax=Ancylobacter dichloromethanicus TaxID=518825 RepID=A0A9W6JDK3_9HYPH|nr:ABC transporter ATP-binding protein [Ancylobacter dichloromethanicus]MBS7552132.1 ABC transporter ATP-binding protein [Ancylobacter dichloromethanicus]GLK73865.1 ABC transporter ATP-binding protein [Ancylobacter dichloromethanicus]
MLDIDGLDAWYGAAQVLFGLSLKVETGEAVALVGRNGAGKSTTMKALIGLISRRAHRLTLRGADISALPTHVIARLGIGYVPEDRRIFSDLTVLENLDLGRRRRAPGNTITDWSLEAVFDLFPHLAELRHRPGGQMSGGEQQMLAVARALVGNPALLLLDEPSEGVAPIVVEQMTLALTRLKASGLSLLVSEQNAQFCAAICDRAYTIEQGAVHWHGPMAALAQGGRSRPAFGPPG